MAWLPSYQGPPPAPPDYRMPWPVPSDARWRACACGTSRHRPRAVAVRVGPHGAHGSRAVGAPLVFTHHTRFGDYRHYLGPLRRSGSGAGRRLPGRLLGRLRRRRRARRGPRRRDRGGRSSRAGPATAGRPGHSDRHRPPDPASALAGRSAAARRLAAGHDRGRLGGPAGAREEHGPAARRLCRRRAHDPGLRLRLVGDGRSAASSSARLADAGLARPRPAHRPPAPPRGARARRAAPTCSPSPRARRPRAWSSPRRSPVGLPVVALDGPGVRSSVRDGVDGVVVARDRRTPATRPRRGAAGRSPPTRPAGGRMAARRTRRGGAVRGGGRIEEIGRAVPVRWPARSADAERVAGGMAPRTMLAMRVSLTARLVSHPSIDFGAGRRSPRRARLGLPMGTTVYHLAAPSGSQR